MSGRSLLASDSHSEHSSHGSDPTIVCFIFMACLFGAIIRSVIKRFKLPVPYTVVLIVLGIIIGILSSNLPEVAEYTTIASMDPHHILTIFLPVLIFESAFAMDAHTFLKSFIQIVILAIPGLCVASFMTCLLAVYVFDYGWDWMVGMMFGSIMSATDPVAVVALLKDLGASKQLATVIEGESLLNDGAALVLFSIFLKLAKPGGAMSGEAIVAEFFKVAVGGSAWGFLMGKISTFWLARIFNDAITEITLTLAFTYLTYYIGEVMFGVSGVLAVVVLGVAVSAEKTSISPEVEVFLHRFWEMLAYLANTLIFILVGVVITEQAVKALHDNDWFYIIALYVGLNVIRAMTIALFSPLLSKVGYGMSWRNGAILTWGGLRGAVGLALALLVARDPDIDQTTIGNKILLHCAGIVMLTLIVNATTVGSLLKMLGMSDISGPKRLAMANAVKHLGDMKKLTISMLRGDRFLADSDWDLVDTCTEIKDPYHEAALNEGVQEPEVGTYLNRFSTCPTCETEVPNEPSVKELEEMQEEARLRLLKVEKVSYWKQFEQGMLSREAVRKLMDSTEVAADTPGGFIRVDDLKRTWQVRGFYSRAKKKIEAWVNDRNTNQIPPPQHPILLYAYRITQQVWFEIVVYFVIISNLAPIIAEFIVEAQLSGTPEYPQYQLIFRIINITYFALYILEALVKIMGHRRYYLKSYWNHFDIFIIVLALLDIILDLTVDLDTGGFSPTIFRFAKTLKLLRISRALRLFKALIPQVLNFLNRRINRQLMFGYDIGKGFVTGEDEARKIMDHLIGDKKIAQAMKEHSYTCRIAVIKELGHIQRKHPGIAVSVKTRQAIRTVLNRIADVIGELRGDGLLDKDEAHKLESMIEERMKKTMNLPSYIAPPRPQKILSNISWVSGDKELIEYLEEKAQLSTFDYNNIIIRRGQMPQGIYIIISGMVKVVAKVADYSSFCNLDEVTSSDDIDQPDDHHESEYIDYLTAGSVIGEMGVLTLKPRNCTISCETSVQCYFIPLDDILQGMRAFPRLEYRLWRVCAIRMASALLMREPQYHGWTQERIKLHLEKSFLADLENVLKFNIERTTMQDVIIIHGTVTNYHTHEVYRAPRYISQTVQKLEINNDGSQPVILIVPTEDSGPPPIIKTTASSVSFMYGPDSPATSNSNLCLKHASRARLAAKQKLENERKNSLRNFQRRMSIMSGVQIQSSIDELPRFESRKSATRATEPDRKESERLVKTESYGGGQTRGYSTSPQPDARGYLKSPEQGVTYPDQTFPPSPEQYAAETMTPSQVAWSEDDSQLTEQELERKNATTPAVEI